MLNKLVLYVYLITFLSSIKLDFMVDIMIHFLTMNKIYIGFGALLLVILGVIVLWSGRAGESSQTIKIGVLTDLTGPAAAYWGESTQAGAELAARDLRAKGYKVEMVYEDYKLDAAKAASAAQKLLNVDRVDAMYIDFNPAILTVASIVARANIPVIYDAAVTSALSASPNFFKTYLDYQAGCKVVAQKFKDEGKEKIGVLKINIEAGELCLKGVREVYPNALVEGYNLNETDFRTSMLKLKNTGVTAVIDVGFEEDVYNILKANKELGSDFEFGLSEDSLTPNTLGTFGAQLKGSWSFGFKAASADFSKRVDAVYGKTYPSYWGAELASTHVTEMIESLAACSKEITCTTKNIAESKPDANIGFRGFENRIANLDMLVKQY